MITPGDDFPLHQTSRPFRDPGTERNTYDRFFFNGYTTDGSVFFAVALGLYAGRNVMDAAFSVQVEGVQHNLRASRLLGADRLDTRVGPLRVRIVEPLRRLDVEVDDRGAGGAGSGIGATLHFAARGPAFEEPHYLWQPGHRALFDVTRMTQNGSWSGSIELPGTTLRLEHATTWGTRDRSWGVRPIGEAEPPGAPDAAPGFYWLWAPLNFDDTCVLFDVNELPDGRRWHESAMWADSVGAAGPGGSVDSADSAGAAGLAGSPLDAPVVSGTAEYDLEYKPGTRHAASAELRLASGDEAMKIRLARISDFFMQGIGYTHPTWGHGTWVGDDVSSYDTLDLASADETVPMHQHVQTLCRAEREGRTDGIGVLEQLIIGPHAPSGLRDLLDMHS